MHYSWDYAQQVHYPADPMQPGPIFFKTSRKCGISGVCIDALPLQITHLIDEIVNTGKGANATISFLHHFLRNHGLGETNVHFHADNCSGSVFLHSTISRIVISVFYSISFPGVLYLYNNLLPYALI